MCANVSMGLGIQGVFIGPGSLLHSHSFTNTFVNPTILHLASLLLNITYVKHSLKTGSTLNVLWLPAPSRFSIGIDIKKNPGGPVHIGEPSFISAFIH